MVAGQDAEAAGVLRQHGGDAELGREVARSRAARRRRPGGGTSGRRSGRRRGRPRARAEAVEEAAVARPAPRAARGRTSPSRRTGSWPRSTPTPRGRPRANTSCVGGCQDHLRLPARSPSAESGSGQDRTDGEATDGTHRTDGSATSLDRSNPAVRNRDRTPRAALRAGLLRGLRGPVEFARVAAWSDASPSWTSCRWSTSDASRRRPPSGEPFPVARDRVPRGTRPPRRRGGADRPRRRGPPARADDQRRRGPRPLTSRWVTPDAEGAVDLRGARLVRPDRHLGARRRAQDPGRRRRRADVHRGPAAVRAGAAPTADRRARDDARCLEGAVERGRDTERPVEARLAALQDPELDAACSRRTRSASCVTVEGPYPAYADRPRALFGSWYEFFPRSEGATRDAETGTGHQRHLPHRRQAARRRGRDGLRRHLPAADPPDRRGQPQGPEQHAHPGPRRPRLALGDRQQGRRARRRSTPTSAPSTTSTPSWRGPATSASRSPSTSPCSARPTTRG